MSVRIRFARIGRPHTHFYRLVATPRTQARDAKPVEILGTMNPHATNKPESIKVERIKYWLSVGAKPTEGVVHALKTHGLWDQVKPSVEAAAKA